MEHFVDIGNLIGLAFAILIFAGVDWLSAKTAAMRGEAEPASCDKSDAAR